MDETQCSACGGAGGFAPFDGDGDGSGGHECAACLGSGQVSVPGTFDAMQAQRRAIEGRLAVARQVRPVSAISFETRGSDGTRYTHNDLGDTVQIGQHTYRRVDTDGRFVLSPQCDTLAGLVAHVAGNPEDAAGVAALCDRLAESGSPHTEIPAAVGELVRGVRKSPTWSRERPTESGLYWIREGPHDNILVVVRITVDPDGHEFCRIWFIGSEVDEWLYHPNYDNLEWMPAKCPA